MKYKIKILLTDTEKNKTVSKSNVITEWLAKENPSIFSYKAMRIIEDLKVKLDIKVKN